MKLILFIIIIGLCIGAVLAVFFLLLIRFGNADTHPHKSAMDLLHTEEQAPYHKADIVSGNYWQQLGVAPPEQCTGKCSITHGVGIRQCSTCKWDDY
jgi:hypothetical protein